MQYKYNDESDEYPHLHIYVIKLLIIGLSILCNLLMNLFYFKSLKLLGSKATLLNFGFNYCLTVTFNYDQSN